MVEKSHIKGINIHLQAARGRPREMGDKGMLQGRLYGKKNKEMVSKSTIGFRRSISCLISASLLLILCCCTVSPTPKDSGKSLVDRENPIFDRRFKELAFKDLDLKNLWIEGMDPNNRENVQVHNNTFSEITEGAKQGVVNIYTRRLEEREAKFGISPNDILPIRIPVISNIFDIIPFKIPIPFRTQGFSLGSGFIINEHGFVLTNAHVINNATDIRVVLSGGRKEYPAKIIGSDRMTDTALIKIQPDIMLQSLPLGDSDSLRIGEMVLAIGNPLGLRHTVTSGIVSAKERISPELNERLVDFIQTDSAINPGSSGGPLLNLYGEVIGINTALVSQAQSIGFAVPINTVKEVMPLLVLGQTERGWFGVKGEPLSPKKGSELGYQDRGGILIVEVVGKSPAEKAGLRPGDIIVELKGQSLNTLKGFLLFRRKLLGFTPGSEIHLKIFRDGVIREVSSTLARKDPEKKVEKKAAKGEIPD